MAVGLPGADVTMATPLFAFWDNGRHGYRDFPEVPEAKRLKGVADRLIQGGNVSHFLNQSGPWLLRGSRRSPESEVHHNLEQRQLATEPVGISGPGFLPVCLGPGEGFLRSAKVCSFCFSAI
jgi:hypothetical protein